MNLDALFDAFPVLETPRLTLRRLTPADTDDAATFSGDPEVGRHTTWLGMVERLGMTDFLALIQQIMAARELAMWGVVPKDEGRVVGFVGLDHLVSGDRRVELGYALARQYWGRGYAPEAVRAVVDYAFVGLGCNRVEAFCTAGNDASIRVLEKVGLRREGVLREHTTIDGRLRDRAVYAILRSDWEARGPLSTPDAAAVQREL